MNSHTDKTREAFCRRRHPLTSHVASSRAISTGCITRFPVSWIGRNCGRPRRKVEVVKLFDKMLDGVEAAHLHGVTHRDLKPANTCSRACQSAQLCGGSVTIVSGQTRNREDSRYGCSMHSYRGSQVCPNNVLAPRRILKDRLLAGLPSEVLRPEVVEYTLASFEDELARHN
jgi:hypothetical protein